MERGRCTRQASDAAPRRKGQIGTKYTVSQESFGHPDTRLSRRPSKLKVVVQVTKPTTFPSFQVSKQNMAEHTCTDTNQSWQSTGSTISCERATGRLCPCGAGGVGGEPLNFSWLSETDPLRSFLHQRTMYGFLDFVQVCSLGRRGRVVCLQQ